MKLIVALFFLFSVAFCYAQDTIQFVNHKGKEYEAILPTQGMIKLKNGEKHTGLITMVSNDKISLRRMTDDAGTIREARKNKVLTDQERNDMLFIDPVEASKSDVESISFMKKRGLQGNSIKKGGIYVLMGMAGIAAVLSSIQDLENNEFPIVAVGSVIAIGGLVLLTKSSASKKLDFYKWKIK